MCDTELEKRNNAKKGVWGAGCSLPSLRLQPEHVHEDMTLGLAHRSSGIGSLWDGGEEQAVLWRGVVPLLDRIEGFQRGERLDRWMGFLERTIIGGHDPVDPGGIGPNISRHPIELCTKS